MYEGFTRVPLASYKYSEAWASLRGIDRGHSARGVIAQELAEIFPEHVKVIPNYVLRDKTVSYTHLTLPTKLTV